ncbi:MAG: hypothetical protein ACR2IH_11595 [Pyrinomonadaceae bacterium]
MNEIEETDDKVRPTLKDRVGGAAQFIIGEIESLAGVVNADPLAQAEGEFNVEVGAVREEAKQDLDENRAADRRDEDES